MRPHQDFVHHLDRVEVVAADVPIGDVLDVKPFCTAVILAVLVVVNGEDNALIRLERPVGVLLVPVAFIVRRAKGRHQPVIADGKSALQAREVDVIGWFHAALTNGS